MTKPVALVAALLLAALTGCSAGTAQEASPVAGAAYHGIEPDPAPARPSFVLRDTAGKRFDFAAETRGRPTLVYFGYVNCPDECPTAMADIATALRRQPADLRARTKVVFVTTDPARDTGARIRQFLDQWSADYVGLTGTTAEVEAAQRAAGVRPGQKGELIATIPDKPDQHTHKPGTAPHKHFGPLGYSVEHTNVIFAYDATDRLPVVYPGGVTPADIAADLPILDRPGKTS